MSQVHNEDISVITSIWKYMQKFEQWVIENPLFGIPLSVSIFVFIFSISAMITD